MTNEIKWGGIRDFDIKHFQTVLTEELIPYVDSHFRTLDNPENRAMAGLSMGGMETRMITTNKPGLFQYYGLLSGGTYSPEDLKEHEDLKLVFLSAGSKENPDRVKQAAKALNDAGIKAVSYVSENTAHEFLTWRRSLYQMALLLFNE